MRYAAAALILALAACRREEIQVYKVAKPEGGGTASAAPAMPPAAAPASPSGALPDGHPPVGGGAGMGALPPEMAQMATASPSSLAWKAQPGWKEMPASGMRRATFVVSGEAGPAELSVISLPGDAGGDLANVNRWRGQVGLAPWDEAGFKKGAEALSSPAGKMTVVDLPGGAQRMLAAMLNRGGETWFFKLTGPDKTVAGAKAAFKAFLGSVRPSA